MKPKFGTLERKLSEIKKNNLLRTLQDSRIEKQYIKINKKKLSEHKLQEKTIIYPTGYMANLGVISALAGKQDTIFSDELNHASIVEALSLIHI